MSAASPLSAAVAQAQASLAAMLAVLKQQTRTDQSLVAAIEQAAEAGKAAQAAPPPGTGAAVDVTV